MSEAGGGAVRPQFSVGGVLEASFKLFFRRFGLFYFIALLFSAAAIALQFSLVVPMLTRMTDISDEAIVVTALSAALLGGAIDVIAFALTFTLIGYGVVSAHYGRRVGFGETLSEGMGRVLYALGAAIAQTIAVVIGFILLIAPGVIAAVFFFVGPAAAIVEQRGPIGALSRSAELTKGRRWEVFGLIVLVIAIAMLMGLVIGMIQLILDPSQLALGEPEIDDGALYQVPSFGPAVIAEGMFSALINGFSAVLTMITFLELKAEKDGADPAAVSEVFE